MKINELSLSDLFALKKDCLDYCKYDFYKSDFFAILLIACNKEIDKRENLLYHSINNGKNENK